MNKALKSLLAVIALGTASIASAVSIPNSGTIELALTENRIASVGGGEFAAKIGGVEFLTFCVERSQPLSSYLETLPSYSSFDYTAPNNVTSLGNTLSVGTAHLFRLFNSGNLAGYNFGAGRASSASELQLAIWRLEGQAGSGQAPDSNIFLQAVIAEFGSLDLAKVDTDNNYVKAIRVWGPAGEDYQDVLVYVPDAGATLALLGFALAGLAVVRRRVRS